MRPFTTIAHATLLGLALAGPALAQTHAHDHGSRAAAAKPARPDNASTRAFKEADRVMMRNMDIAYTGDPDVDFRRHMVPHHQGAIDMARVALAHAKDPATKAMAENIIADQEREIAEMQDWLKTNAR